MKIDFKLSEIEHLAIYMNPIRKIKKKNSILKAYYDKNLFTFLYYYFGLKCLKFKFEFDSMAYVLELQR